MCSKSARRRTRSFDSSRSVTRTPDAPPATREGATTPSDASGPWRDGASGPDVHSWCSCVRGSHASCGGGCDWAEKCASWITRLTVTGRGRTAEPLMVDVARKRVNKAGSRVVGQPGPGPVVSSSAPLGRRRVRRRAVGRGAGGSQVVLSIGADGAPGRFSTIVEKSVENSGLSGLAAMKTLVLPESAYGEGCFVAILSTFSRS